MELQDIQQVCAICSKSEYMHEGVKNLYGHQVCKKCFKGFLNRREGAFLIDIFLWYMSMAAFGFIFNLQQYQGSEFICSIVFWILFFIKDGFSGYSPGKAIFGIQTYHEPSGQPAGFIASIKRNVIMIVPIIILFLIIDIKKGYRLGDKWANTKVIWKKYQDKDPFALNINI